MAATRVRLSDDLRQLVAEAATEASGLYRQALQGGLGNRTCLLATPSVAKKKPKKQEPPERTTKDSLTASELDTEEVGETAADGGETGTGSALAATGTTLAGGAEAGPVGATTVTAGSTSTESPHAASVDTATGGETASTPAATPAAAATTEAATADPSTDAENSTKGSKQRRKKGAPKAKQRQQTVIRFGRFVPNATVARTAALDPLPPGITALAQACAAPAEAEQPSLGLLPLPPNSCDITVLEPGRWLPPLPEGVQCDNDVLVVCLEGEVQLAAGTRLAVGPTRFGKDVLHLRPGDCVRLSRTDRTEPACKIALAAAECRRMVLTLRCFPLDMCKDPEQKPTKAQVKTLTAEELPGTSELATPAIEQQHVHQVYDTIASHWHRTRHSPWPQVKQFLDTLEDGSLIADIGCGNGKYLRTPGKLFVGCDISVNLLEKCPRGTTMACDNMNVPLRSDTFDGALSIAVLHHFSTEARRLQALREVARVVRPGGRFLVYAWALEQENDSRREFPQQDVLVPWHHMNPEQEKGAEQTVASAQGDSPQVYYRYCHVYRRGELEELVHRLPGVRVVQTYFDSSNWCVIAEKQAV
eukprot:m.191832 g.191832  ORF g.191832 m.191832 type:complete len:589 (-) comp18254_c3_seq4:39-1805(-)